MLASSVSVTIANTSFRPRVSTVCPTVLASQGVLPLRLDHSSFPQHEPDQALVRDLIQWILSTCVNRLVYSFQNYTDYFKCIAAKGEDFAPCKQFKRAYNSLCPSA